MHNLLKKRIFPAILLVLVLLSPSCADKETKTVNENRTEQAVETEKVDQLWYYFYQESETENPLLKEVKTPDLVPKTEFKPWTEALRVSGLGLMYDPPLFLVNRAGILYLSDFYEFPQLKIKPEFYSKTAEGFYNTDAGCLIRLYTNTIFSTMIPLEETTAGILRYNNVNSELKALVYPENFKLEKIAQLSALEFKKKWFVSFKTEKNEKVHFNYFSFLSFDELLKGNYTKITQEEFINESSPLIKVSDKDGIEKILTLPQKNIKVDFFSKELKTKQTAFCSNSNEEYAGDFDITASICEFEPEKSGNILKAVLFSTGMFFYLDEETKEWKEKKLPNLPQGFIYTYFAIKNGIIICAWEEQQFFETGRAGLLVYKIR